MKLRIFALTLIALVSAESHAALSNVRASAFTDKGILYVTILGDTCNAVGMNLVLDDDCKQDNPFRSPITVCYARPAFVSTARACPPGVEPKILTANLDASNVAVEATTMKLIWPEGEIDLVIHRD